MLRELIIILFINYLGLCVSTIFHLPIPGTIIGMLIMLLLLYFKILKLESIENVANFLLANMAIFFIPPTMRILDLLNVLEAGFSKIILLLTITTFVTLGVTGKVVELMIKITEKNKKENK